MAVMTTLRRKALAAKLYTQKCSSSYFGSTVVDNSDFYHVIALSSIITSCNSSSTQIADAFCLPCDPGG